MTLRETVRNLMVARHGITPELADDHVAQMDTVELKRRFFCYARIVRCRDAFHEREPHFETQGCDQPTVLELSFFESGMELSAESPRLRAGNESSTRFSRPATMTAGSQHSTLLPRRSVSCQIRK